MADQILEHVYDPDTKSLKTTTNLAINLDGTQEILIDDLHDSIKLGNGSGQYAAVSATGALTANPTDYATRVDNTTTANVLYVGKAAIGSATSAGIWQVKKIDTTTGVIITWAAGGAFSQIWDNRASLSYT